MQERDPVTLGAGSWRAVDQLDALVRQSVQRPFQVGDPERYVMKTGSAPIEEPRDGRGFRNRLDEFDYRRSAAEERDVDALRFDPPHGGTGCADNEFQNRHRVRDRANGDRDVIDG
jgi:hypothetical protein